MGKQQSTVIDECKRNGGLMCGDIRGIYDVDNRRKDTSLEHT